MADGSLSNFFTNSDFAHQMNAALLKDNKWMIPIAASLLGAGAGGAVSLFTKPINESSSARKKRILKSALLGAGGAGLGTLATMAAIGAFNQGLSINPKDKEALALEKSRLENAISSETNKRTLLHAVETGGPSAGAGILAGKLYSNLKSPAQEVAEKVPTVGDPTKFNEWFTKAIAGKGWKNLTPAQIKARMIRQMSKEDLPEFKKRWPEIKANIVEIRNNTSKFINMDAAEAIQKSDYAKAALKKYNLVEKPGAIRKLLYNLRKIKYGPIAVGGTAAAGTAGLIEAGKEATGNNWDDSMLQKWFGYDSEAKIKDATNKLNRLNEVANQTK